MVEQQTRQERSSRPGWNTGRLRRHSAPRAAVAARLLIGLLAGLLVAPWAAGGTPFASAPGPSPRALVWTGALVSAQASIDAERHQLWLPLLARHALIGELTGRIGQALTAHESDEWEPVVSSDGRWIAYLARPMGAPSMDGRARLRVMASDGSCDHVLALPPFADLDLPVWDAPFEEDPGVTPWLLFSALSNAPGAAAQWDIYRVRLKMPTDDDGARCPTVNLTSAPGRTELQQEDEAELINLTATPDRHEGRAALSPDGRWLAFDEAALDGADWNIALLDLEGDERRLLTRHPAYDRKPAFSPDGRHVVFRSQRSGRSQIFRVDVDGGGLARLTFTEGNDGYPSYSPDGRHILFESDKGGTKGLYLMDAFGRGRQVLLSDDRLRFATPSWHPNGTEALFSAGLEGESLDLHRMRLPVLDVR